MKPLQVLLALFACAFLPLHAASLADLTYTTTDGEVTITDCDTLATGELIIPDTIEGKPVTSIGIQAFYNCSSLTSITIPDGVTSIGDYAFGYCTSLTSITIPDSVTSIGESAFQFCTSLTSITIGNGVTSIGFFAFYECTSLTSITIGNGVTSIGAAAFFRCTRLTSITIPDGVTSIGIQAFSACNRLANITFQGVAPTVGREAFLGVADGAVASVTMEALSSFGASGADWNGLTVSMSASYLNDLLAQVAELSQRPTAEQLATVEAERDARPTQTSYNTVVAERDARFTEDQIRTMSADHTVGQNEAGNMQVEIAFVQSTDLNTYTPFTVIPDSLSVVDGKICMEFPPSDDENFFFRFRIE
jgi:hypothetical protein